MKFHIKTTNLDLTPSLENYLKNKFSVFERLLKKIDKEGAVEVWTEMSRVSRHHRKGEVFRAETDIRLPGKILRAEAIAPDIRSAIDELKDELKKQINKYRAKQKYG